MADAILDTGKRRGRPATGATGIHVKLLPADLAALDAWIDEQKVKQSRPEAIRTLMKLALPSSGTTLVRKEFD